MLEYQRESLEQALGGLAEAETAMIDERWSDAMIALMTVGWAIDALRNTMPNVDETSGSLI